VTPLIDFRLYRLAFLPMLLAVIALMFSLEGAPDPIEPATPPATFEGDRAAAQARQVASMAPDRRPGSEGDSAIADLVAERFEEILAGAVTEQAFEAEFEGEDVSLRNVLLTLPGETASTVVILAPRDAARGPGAATSAAATGILIELADALRVGHEKTYVLASTSGTAAGAAGARQLLESLPERDAVEAVIVISQPGAPERRAPFVVTSSTDERSGSVQLERTAEEAVSAQAQEPSSEPSAFSQLARLAIPSGLGGQAPLIAEGFDAVAISSAGERPLSESEDGPDDLSGENLDAFGRAIQSTVNAVDASSAPLVHGPGAHLELSDNLVPGWTLALLALTLILPAAVAAVDACARAGRRRLGLAAGLAWAAARSLPFVGALAALYALAIVGAVPRPPFPFDPGLYGLGTRAAIMLPVILLTGIGSAGLLRRRGVTARAAPPAALAGLGVVSVAACGLVWLANPYLALLMAPAAHVWLLAAGTPGPARGTLAIAGATLACLPAIAALAAVSDALELGGRAPWTFTLMIADGQIGLPIIAAACFLAGALVGAIALSVRRRARLPAQA
jgi:hypothetical protein